jgi:hypothetical protein
MDRYRAARISIRMGEPVVKSAAKPVATSVPVTAAKVGSCRGRIQRLAGWLRRLPHGLGGAVGPALPLFSPTTARLD